MRTHRKNWRLGSTTIVLTAAFLMPHAALGAAHHAHATQTEHFLFLSNNRSYTARKTVIATGPIHARGYDIATGTLTDTLVFPKGSLFMRHTPTNHHWGFDKVTGSGTETETGTYDVTGGTGAYSCQCQMGFGNYHLHITYWAPRPIDEFKGFQAQIHAAGQLTLPR
jgi:hypothetical protein